MAFGQFGGLSPDNPASRGEKKTLAKVNSFVQQEIGVFLRGNAGLASRLSNWDVVELQTNGLTLEQAQERVVRAALNLIKLLSNPQLQALKFELSSVRVTTIRYSLAGGDFLIRVYSNLTGYRQVQTDDYRNELQTQEILNAALYAAERDPRLLMPPTKGLLVAIAKQSEVVDYANPTSTLFKRERTGAKTVYSTDSKASEIGILPLQQIILTLTGKLVELQILPTSISSKVRTGLHMGMDPDRAGIQLPPGFNLRLLDLAYLAYDSRGAYFPTEYSGQGIGLAELWAKIQGASNTGACSTEIELNTIFLGIGGHDKLATAEHVAIQLDSGRIIGDEGIQPEA